ncbi:MAG: sulfatase-like hydrolase/transferase [Phenylobacterium sp.]
MARKTPRRRQALWAGAASGALSILGAQGALAAPALTPPKAARPNIVVILFDDVALMDLGAYGGEARTPNIDRLARQGARFTGYRTSPRCTPARALLLTGLDNHRAGAATIEEILPPEMRNQPGYRLRIEPEVLTIAERLRAEGYRTLMAGKWHLGHGPGELPDGQGFDRSLALDASGADNWAPRSYMPYYTDAPWYEGGRPTKMPGSFYSSDMLVDRLTRYIDEAPAGRAPFFAYLALQAVHIPVQAPARYSDGYRGRFDGGWEALRQARAERARRLGLLPAGAAVDGFSPDARDWDALPADERRMAARSMEVYAGMIEAADAAIGRLMQRLAARGELDNTLFVVTSDNGPEPSDPVHQRGMGLWMRLNGYSWRLEGLGGPGSLNYVGPEWAEALAAPGRRYKFYVSEGGIRAPLIVSGPGVAAGRRIDGLTFVTDVTPTLADFAGARPTPGTPAMDGVSLRPLLEGGAEPVRGPDSPLGIEVSGNAALYRGDFKIVRDMPPLGDGRWRLYDIVRDPGETRDLSTADPGRLKAMLADYAAYEARVGVAPLPPDYNTQKQLTANVLARQMPLLASAAAILALLLGGGFLASRWRRRARGGA